jgi:hypothetical protein
VKPSFVHRGFPTHSPARVDKLGDKHSFKEKLRCARLFVFSPCGDG